MKKALSIIFTAIWLMALAAGGVYYLFLAPKEATYSKEENRNLAGMPVPSVKTVVSGEFGEGIEEYLLDNFPGRNFLNSNIKTAKGFLSIATYEDYLAIADGAKDPLDTEVDLGDIEDLLADNKEPTTEENTEPSTEDSTEETTDDAGMEQPEVETEPLENPPIEPKPEVDLADFPENYGIYMDKGDGLSAVYSYSKNNVAALTTVLNKYARLLPEDGKLMFTVAMQSIVNNKFVNASNKISYYGDWDDLVNAYGDDNVYAFDTAETLCGAIQAGEYVTFRTDGHWTPYGAYLMYEQMVARAGKEVADYYKDFEHDTWTPFRGTYYRDYQSAYENVLPDDLELLKPKFATEVRRITAKDQYVLLDFIDYNARDNDRYTMYLGGPAGPWTYVVSDNGETENCLVVTDSFGMCYLPFLTTNYKEVHYYDARYYDYNLVGYTVAEMIEKHNIQDIYVIVADFHSFNSSFLITNANKHLYNE